MLALARSLLPVLGSKIRLDQLGFYVTYIPYFGIYSFESYIGFGFDIVVVVVVAVVCSRVQGVAPRKPQYAQ